MQHRQHSFERYAFAASPHIAIITFGGAMAEAAALRGLLRVRPVTAEPGGIETMTRMETLGCRGATPRPIHRPPRRSRNRRARHVRQVTVAPGGSVQAERAPGSAVHSAIRQYGVTA